VPASVWGSGWQARNPERYALLPGRRSVTHKDSPRSANFSITRSSAALSSVSPTIARRAPRKIRLLFERPMSSRNWSPGAASMETNRPSQPPSENLSSFCPGLLRIWSLSALNVASHMNPYGFVAAVDILQLEIASMVRRTMDLPHSRLLRRCRHKRRQRFQVVIGRTLPSRHG
jgi:hypothetical protein